MNKWLINYDWGKGRETEEWESVWGSCHCEICCYPLELGCCLDISYCVTDQTQHVLRHNFTHTHKHQSKDSSTHRCNFHKHTHLIHKGYSTWLRNWSKCVCAIDNTRKCRHIFTLHNHTHIWITANTHTYTQNVHRTRIINADYSHKLSLALKHFW